MTFGWTRTTVYMILQASLADLMSLLESDPVAEELHPEEEEAALSLNSSQISLLGVVGVFAFLHFNVPFIMLPGKQNPIDE